MENCISIVMALLLILPGGAPVSRPAEVSLEALVEEIQTGDPETAAESLLEWVREGSTAEEARLREILTERNETAAATAKAFAAVLDAAETLLDSDPAYGDLDGNAYAQAVRSLSPLFTDLLAEPTTPYRMETGGTYPASLSAFDGIWCDSETGELLIFRGDTCRVVIPYLDHFGEKACAARLRDRSAMGYCPALEIDFHDSGDFWGPLAYYVSGVDGTHFWSNTQGQRFDKIA